MPATTLITSDQRSYWAKFKNSLSTVKNNIVVRNIFATVNAGTQLENNIGYALFMVDSFYNLYAESDEPANETWQQVILWTSVLFTGATIVTTLGTRFLHIFLRANLMEEPLLEDKTITKRELDWLGKLIYYPLASGVFIQTVFTAAGKYPFLMKLYGLMNKKQEASWMQALSLIGAFVSFAYFHGYDNTIGFRNAETVAWRVRNRQIDLQKTATVAALGSSIPALFSFNFLAYYLLQATVKPFSLARSAVIALDVAAIYSATSGVLLKFTFSAYDMFRKKTPEEIALLEEENKQNNDVALQTTNKSKLEPVVRNIVFANGWVDSFGYGAQVHTSVVDGMSKMFNASVKNPIINTVGAICWIFVTILNFAFNVRTSYYYNLEDIDKLRTQSARALEEGRIRIEELGDTEMEAMSTPYKPSLRAAEEGRGKLSTQAAGLSEGSNKLIDQHLQASRQLIQPDGSTERTPLVSSKSRKARIARTQAEATGVMTSTKPKRTLSGHHTARGSSLYDRHPAAQRAVATTDHAQLQIARQRREFMFPTH